MTNPTLAGARRALGAIADGNDEAYLTPRCAEELLSYIEMLEAKLECRTNGDQFDGGHS